LRKGCFEYFQLFGLDGGARAATFVAAAAVVELRAGQASGGAAGAATFLLL
jgi:hypothetical protein